MKLLRFCVVGLLPICGVFADEDVIKSQSPDGKFALRLASAFGGSAAAIIDAKSHAVVLDKNEFGEDVLHVSTEVPNSDGETKGPIAKQVQSICHNTLPWLSSI